MIDFKFRAKSTQAYEAWPSVIAVQINLVCDSDSFFSSYYFAKAL